MRRSEPAGQNPICHRRQHARPLSQTLGIRAAAQQISGHGCQWCCLAHVYGQPSGAINRLTNNEAQCISKLISRLPSWWRMEEPSKAGSRSKRFLRMNPSNLLDNPGPRSGRCRCCSPVDADFGGLTVPEINLRPGGGLGSLQLLDWPLKKPKLCGPLSSTSSTTQEKSPSAVPSMTNPQRPAFRFILQLVIRQKSQRAPRKLVPGKGLKKPADSSAQQ